MKEMIGNRICILKCTNSQLIGTRGTLVFESMKMLHLNTPKRRLRLPKHGTIIQLEDGEIILCEQMIGRLEERLIKGAKI
jgi:RNase P/RNase MRP subunit p29